MVNDVNDEERYRKRMHKYKIKYNLLKDNLTEVDISELELEPHQIISIMQDVGKSEFIETLDCSAADLDDNSLESLIEAVEKSPSIKEVNISNNDLLSDEAIANFINLIPKKNLTKVYLDGLKFGNKAAQALQYALKNTSSLTLLHLNNVKINAEDAKELVKAIKLNSSIKELVLSFLNLENKGAKEVESALEWNFNITSFGGVHSEEIDSYIKRNKDNVGLIEKALKAFERKEEEVSSKLKKASVDNNNDSLKLDEVEKPLENKKRSIDDQDNFVTQSTPKKIKLEENVNNNAQVTVEVNSKEELSFSDIRSLLKIKPQGSSDFGSNLYTKLFRKVDDAASLEFFSLKGVCKSSVMESCELFKILNTECIIHIFDKLNLADELFTKVPLQSQPALEVDIMGANEVNEE